MKLKTNLHVFCVLKIFRTVDKTVVESKNIASYEDLVLYFVLLIDESIIASGEAIFKF